MHVFHNLCITCSGRTNRIIGVRSRHKSSLAKTFLKVFGAKALVIFLRFCSGPSVVGPPCSNNNWPHRLGGEGEILVDFSSYKTNAPHARKRGRFKILKIPHVFEVTGRRARRATWGGRGGADNMAISRLAAVTIFTLAAAMGDDGDDGDGNGIFALL